MSGISARPVGNSANVSRASAQESLLPGSSVICVAGFYLYFRPRLPIYLLHQPVAYCRGCGRAPSSPAGVCVCLRRGQSRPSAAVLGALGYCFAQATRIPDGARIYPLSAAANPPQPVIGRPLVCPNNASPFEGHAFMGWIKFPCTWITNSTPVFSCVKCIAPLLTKDEFPVIPDDDGILSPKLTFTEDGFISPMKVL